MDTLVERCGGLDVHKAQVTATVRIAEGREVSHDTRTFATTTRGLLALADWLASWRVTRVGMEATGVYWKPVVRHEALCCRAVWDGRRWPVAAGR